MTVHWGIDQMDCIHQTFSLSPPPALPHWLQTCRIVQMKGFAKKNKLDMTFHGGIDHLDSSMHDYRVFVNPSKSDVVATTVKFTLL